MCWNHWNHSYISCNNRDFTRQEDKNPTNLVGSPFSPEELDGDVWDYAIRCLARLDLQRAWQQVLQGPSIQGGKVWGTNWVFSTGKEDFSIECLILHYSFSWMVIDSSMGTCARHLFLPCLGVEVLPNQDIAAASKGLTSEGNRDREINLHAVSLLFGCLFAVFFEGWNSHSKSWEQHLKYLNLLHVSKHEAVPRVAPSARISMKMRWLERWKMIWWRCHRCHSNTHGYLKMAGFSSEGSCNRCGRWLCFVLEILHFT